MKRRDFLKSVSAAGAASVLSAPAVWSPARAQSRQETLLVVTEYGPNNFDIHGVGTNRPGYEVSWNCYDRLMSHGTKTLPDGTVSYDRDTFTPELAEDWNATDTSVTFKLRKNAKFHDGTPITARDVKWSFDRAVSVGGFPTFQMKAGSLEKPEQFVAVGDHTFRVDFIRKDKLTMPDLAVVVPAVFHAELVKKNATEKDPWGLEFTKTNIAGGGAYKVARWQAGTEVVFERNDDWRSGDLPKVRRVIWRQAPSAGPRVPDGRPGRRGGRLLRRLDRAHRLAHRRHHHGVPAVRAGHGHRGGLGQLGGEHHPGHRHRELPALCPRGPRRGQRAARGGLRAGGQALRQRRDAHPPWPRPPQHHADHDRADVAHHGYAILNAAGLSFIGLGVRPPTPEWGIMVAEGAAFMVSGEWWIAFFPGATLMLAVFCFNLLGDGLRDIVDPQRRT